MELSQRELQKVKVIENAVQGRITVQEASGLLQLSRRQVQRLKARYVPDEAGWVRHGNRGRPRPWAIAETVKKRIVELARTKYAGFNDSHLTEKLVEAEKIAVSRRTVRRLLRRAQLKSPQRRRARKYQARERKPRMGMMVLTDASREDWMEGRGPALTLIGYQDDATGQVSERLPVGARGHAGISAATACAGGAARSAAEPVSGSTWDVSAQR